jgi:hypothetical protein
MIDTGLPASWIRRRRPDRNIVSASILNVELPSQCTRVGHEFTS